MTMATPAGWEYEESLSHKFGFIQTGKENERLKFLRNEGGAKGFLDLETGKEVFVGRTS